MKNINTIRDFLEDKMKYSKKFIILSAMIPMLLYNSGCSKKEINTKDVTSQTETEPKNETEKKVIIIQNKMPELPHTEKEFDEKFGTENEDGVWIPPEGAYRDPKTGNIKNKDGVVIGGGEAPHKARPGSKG